MIKKQQQQPSKEIYNLTNGSRIQIESWTPDKRSIYGYLVDDKNIMVYVPVSYLQTKKRDPYIPVRKKILF
jgi:homospermidine synthase